MPAILKNSLMPLVGWLLIVVTVRESIYGITQHYGYSNIANLVGLFVLLIALSLYKQWRNLPQWLLDANNKVMKESGFVLLPYIAGASGLIALLGSAWVAFVAINLLATLPFLVLVAWLAKKYVMQTPSVNQ